MVSGKVVRDTTETILEELNGLRSPDEEINQVYAKPILKNSGYSSNATTDSQNATSIIMKPRWKDEAAATEVNNALRMKDVAKKHNAPNLNLDNFRKRLL